MEDMMAQINQAMQNPEMMTQLNSIAQMLMSSNTQPQSGTAQNSQQSSPDLSSVLGSLFNNSGQQNNSSLQNNSSHSSNQGTNQSSDQSMPDLSFLSGLFNNGQNASPPPSSPQLDMNRLLKLGDAMKNAQKKDETVELILALKPFLKEEKRQKADKIVKLLRMLSMIPVLRESGILGGDLFGGT